jgi:hypothetical protein
MRFHDGRGSVAATVCVLRQVNESIDIERKIFGVDLFIGAVFQDGVQSLVQLIGQGFITLADGDTDFVVDINGLADKFVFVVAGLLQPIVGRVDIGQQCIDATGL